MDAYMIVGKFGSPTMKIGCTQKQALEAFLGRGTLYIDELEDAIKYVKKQGYTCAPIKILER